MCLKRGWGTSSGCAGGSTTRAASVSLPRLREGFEPLVDVLSGEHCIAARRGGYRLKLEGDGDRWFRLGSEDEAQGRGTASEA